MGEEANKESKKVTPEFKQYLKENGINIDDHDITMLDLPIVMVDRETGKLINPNSNSKNTKVYCVETTNDFNLFFEEGYKTYLYDDGSARYRGALRGFKVKLGDNETGFKWHEIYG